MPNGAKRNPLIAVDSNVLLDRANDDELVLDALDTVRRRLPACEFIVTPTVIEEIVLKAERGDTPLDRRLARRVLASLVEPWGFRPLSFIPVGRGIVAEIARQLRRQGLIPDSEMNDSLIVAEAALIGATLLVSSDAHLKDLDYARLKLVLDAADVATPLVASPFKIVNQFF
jgi:predicted nucleic acid-binding protein